MTEGTADMTEGTANPPAARVNDVGDVVLEDVRQLRALADRDRLAAFDWLQKHGPQPAEAVAAALGVGADEARAALDILASAGLVQLRDDAWAAAGRGLFLAPPPDDAEARAATRTLGVVMLGAAADTPRRWLADVEPTLDDHWAGAAGMFNAGVVLTSEEVEHVQAELEVLLEPYLNRPVGDRPADARRIRLLAYFLPDAD